MSGWDKNEPGDTPVCLVGAGFQMAVLDPPLPSTKDIISKTIEKFTTDFPALARVGPLLSNTDLNYVWTNICRISEIWQFLTPEIVKSYSRSFSNKPMGALVASIQKQWESRPDQVLSTILGVELKRMVAFQYDQEKIKLKDPLPEGLTKFIDANTTKTVIWISLNYELSLENVLGKPPVGDEKWKYAFQGLFEKDGGKLFNEVNHVIAKPHGSLNVWFTTVWESRVSFGKRNLHQLSFVNITDRLKTCPLEEIGYKVGSDPPAERRPWVIGYLRDAMKDEINSPGFFADTAHDLCKWNVTYGALALQKASSLYILGYSMPEEDRWVWERLVALRKKDFPIYVASCKDSDRIVRALKSFGFINAKKLTDDGRI